MVDETGVSAPGGPVEGRESGRLEGAGGLGAYLELLGLWVLAVGQPLLSLVGRNAPFLVHRRLDGSDLLLWSLLVLAVPPLVIWALAVVVDRALGARAAGGLRALALGSLAACFGLGVLRRLGDPLAPWLVVPLAVSAVWLVASLVLRRPRLRRFLAALSLAVPLVAALFWFSPAARAVRVTSVEPVGGTPIDAVGPVVSGAPVILVVFDELPLLSLIDRSGAIDAELCPSFASLAETSTWFRNARTVSPWTNASLASMMVGRATSRETPPTRQSHPENLFTWLSTSHEVRAFELLTALAPPAAVEQGLRPSREVRLRGLSLDSVVVVGHQLLPPALGGWLPEISTRWGDFLGARAVRALDSETPASTTPWDFALTDVRGRQFDTFLDAIERTDRPGFFFAHVMLPHLPYRYLPDGAVYGGRPVYGRPSEAWEENEWFAIETYQRHLLQVGFVDRLVGRLQRRLEATGLWDESLVIVVSDHGASHWPGEERRDPDRSAHVEDILRVPLFVKTPHQTDGRIDDRVARTIDILPTAGEVLGAPVPWVTEGVSLVSGEGRQAEFLPDRESLARKLDLFRPGGGPLRMVRVGPFAEWIGEPAGALEAAGRLPPVDCRAEIDQRPVLAAFDPTGRYSPALLTGRVACEGELPEGVFVLAALNGVVAGSGALQQSEESGGQFAAMTAPSLLVAGANEMTLWVAWGEPSRPRLVRARETSAGSRVDAPGRP